jgi:hypothetical protein
VALVALLAPRAEELAALQFPLDTQSLSTTQTLLRTLVVAVVAVLPKVVVDVVVAAVLEAVTVGIAISQPLAVEVVV